MKLNSLLSVFFVVISSSSLFSHAALAADPTLAETGKNSITANDVLGDALRIPPESRKSTLANPDAVQQLANNLVIRRALAAEAEATGIAQDAAVQSAIRLSLIHI